MRIPEHTLMPRIRLARNRIDKHGNYTTDEYGKQCFWCIFER